MTVFNSGKIRRQMKNSEFDYFDKMQLLLQFFSLAANNIENSG